jgi:hypothetical protein
LAEDTEVGENVAIKRMINIFDDQIDAKRAYREMHILRLGLGLVLGSGEGPELE